jgi:hypothetical protein
MGVHMQQTLLPCTNAFHIMFSHGCPCCVYIGAWQGLGDCCLRLEGASVGWLRCAHVCVTCVSERAYEPSVGPSVVGCMGALQQIESSVRCFPDSFVRCFSGPRACVRVAIVEVLFVHKLPD